MIAAVSIVNFIGLVVAVLALVILLLALRSMVNVVQQGEVGVVKRLGEYRKTHEPGLVIITPVRRVAAARRHARDPAAG